MGKVSIKGIWTVLKKAFKGFSNDKVMKLSASLAYYTVFSIGPMIIVIIYVAGLIYGREAVQGTIFEQIQGLVGSSAAAQIQDMIKSAALNREGNFAFVLGIITLIVGATSVFAEIQDSVNQIWNLKPKPKKGWLKMLTDRLLSFSVIIGLGFILLVSLLVNGLMEILMNRLQARFPNLALVVVYILNILVTFCVITTLFGAIFKVLPDAVIKWKDVIVGSMVTATLFMLGKFAITFYIGSSNVGGTYGAAGSLVILLLWVYYSAVILYFGAEFTKAYATQFGSSIKPSPFAVWVKNIEVEDENGTLKQQEQKKELQNKQTGDDVKVT